MKRNLVLAAVVLVGLASAYVLAQPGAMGSDMKGMTDMQEKMSPDMKTMMAKMSPEMKMRCNMLMNTTVIPNDPAAILALKAQLKLTEAQTTQLEAINKEAQVKAAAVLTIDQQKTLDALPKTPQTMMDMHEQMMGQMQKMMGGKMGEQMMNCPMMTMTSATTQPAQDKLATPEDHAAHH